MCWRYCWISVRCINATIFPTIHPANTPTNKSTFIPSHVPTLNEEIDTTDRELIENNKSFNWQEQYQMISIGILAVGIFLYRFYRRKRGVYQRKGMKQMEI